MAQDAVLLNSGLRTFDLIGRVGSKALQTYRAQRRRSSGLVFSCFPLYARKPRSDSRFFCERERSSP